MSDAYILIVDDEPDICTLVKEILEDEGFEVSTAENAEQARPISYSSISGCRTPTESRC